MNVLNLAPETDLSRFIAETRKFPMLKADEEKDLARRWLEQRDQDALQKLLGSHLRLVVKIARGNSGYGLPMADLVAEGNVGLMLAADRFDPEREFRFSTYATWWIRATMQEYILRSWSLVKMGTTAAQKKLFFNLRRLKGRLRLLEEGDLDAASAAKIARELRVPETEVIEMNRRLASRDWSLNQTVTDEDSSEFQDLLVDESPTPYAIVSEAEELNQRRALLRDAKRQLSKREQKILEKRTLSEEPQTLEELSQVFGVSRERVRQIEARAIEKLRQSMMQAAGRLPGALATEAA